MSTPFPPPTPSTPTGAAASPTPSSEPVLAVPPAPLAAAPASTPPPAAVSPTPTPEAAATPGAAEDAEVATARAQRADQILVALAALLDELDRDDLAARLRAARVRMARPASVVCVVGEFKQGKSSFVNAAIGHAVCPVDDDIATAALTLVRHGDTPRAIVRGLADGEPTTFDIDVTEVASYVTESMGSTAGRRLDRVERVDVMVPSDLLAGGLALVDTPGAGGMSGGHAAATLGFLPFADGLVFVTDLTSELTEPEIDFLRRAHERCPHVLVVETKSDLFPQWRRIHELNVAHLARLGLPLPLLPVSSVLATVGVQRGDTSLIERSGFPEFRRRLEDAILGPAKAGALDRALTEAHTFSDVARSSVRSEREALDDPSVQQRLADEAAAALAKLEQLRGPGARWNVVLGDRLADANNDLNHRLRSSFRDIGRTMDESIEELKTAEEWEGLSARLQADVADAVAQAFAGAEHARRQIRDDLAALIALDEIGAAPSVGTHAEAIDVMSWWRSREIDPGSAAGKAFKTGLTGLRGAQGGIMMLGLGGTFLPSAAAVFMMSNPVLLTVGAAFGGMQLFDERKRRLQARRQAARTQMRQFVDDVQFAVGNELNNLLRTVQRSLRDEFTELVTELHRTWTDAAKRAEESRRASADERDRRRKELDAHERRLAQIAAALDTTAPAGGPS